MSSQECRKYLVTCFSQSSAWNLQQALYVMFLLLFRNAICQSMLICIVVQVAIGSSFVVSLTLLIFIVNVYITDHAAVVQLLMQIYACKTSLILLYFGAFGYCALLWKRERHFQMFLGAQLSHGQTLQSAAIKTVPPNLKMPTFWQASGIYIWFWIWFSMSTSKERSSLYCCSKNRVLSGPELRLIVMAYCYILDGKLDGASNT